MKKILFGLAAAACLGFAAPAFAANGSVANAMVKDAHRAAARRIEAKADNPACGTWKPVASGDCKPGGKVKEKSKVT